MLGTGYSDKAPKAPRQNPLKANNSRLNLSVLSLLIIERALQYYKNTQVITESSPSLNLRSIPRA
jgi:hypothetical protein